MDYIWAAIITVLIIFQHFERKDLYNRIMSRDLNELRGGNVKNPLSGHDKVMKRWRDGD